MNRQIWKYTMALGSTELELPMGAEIVHVASQHDTPCIWVLVDINAEKEIRTFEWYGTGQSIFTPDNRNYVGTIQLAEGTLVYHLFEIIL